MVGLSQHLTSKVVNGSILGLTGLLCSINDSDLAKVPRQGPLILYTNHINFLDAPVLYCRLQPRPLTGFAKSETWDDPLLGPLFSLWGAIPLRRDEADTAALRKGLEVLRNGQILAIAPEGTRSGSGVLQRAHPGVVTMALHSGAPLLPLAIWGNEMFHGNLRRFRRTSVTIRVGKVLHFKIGGERLRSVQRQSAADELMYCLAELMPPAYRGAYSALPEAYQYVQWDAPCV